MSNISLCWDPWGLRESNFCGTGWQLLKMLHSKKKKKSIVNKGVERIAEAACECHPISSNCLVLKSVLMKMAAVSNSQAPVLLHWSVRFLFHLSEKAIFSSLVVNCYCQPPLLAVLPPTKLTKQPDFPDMKAAVYPLENLFLRNTFVDPLWC